ncbi:MAG: hypothetical protein FJY77_05710, partial [Candidatus Altiarchaeales archaeon]|nr:hypothetical protein [Candidatus Altiarchaeales archaeon]
MTEVQQPKPPEVVETSAGVLSRVGPPDDVLKLVQLRDLVGFDSVGSLPWVRSTKLFRARDSESKSKFVNSLGLMASYRNREKGFELWLEESGFVRLIESEFVHVMGEGFFDDLRKVFKGECDTRVIVAENISRTVSAVNMLNNLLSSIPGDATALKSSARFLRSLVADESFSKDDKRYLCEMVWDALSSMKSAGEPAVAGGECDVMLLEAGKFVVSHLVHGVVDSA